MTRLRDGYRGLAALNFQPDLTRVAGGYMHQSPTSIMWDRFYTKRSWSGSNRYHADPRCGGPDTLFEVAVFEDSEGGQFVFHQYTNPNKDYPTRPVMRVLPCGRCIPKGN